MSNHLRLDDSALAHRAGAGDRRAFAELVERHQDAVYRVCYRVLGNRQDAEDAAQEAFVRAFERLTSFEGRSAFKTWLVRLALNVSLNERKKRGRAERKASEALHQTVSEDSPESEAVSADAAERVRTALLLVREDHRAAVVLKDLEGYSFREVGEMLGVSEATARVWAHRGRQRLREVLT
ncbi:sigma70-ECF: RNA polymerase sigma factor, sigma-70 family [Rubrobacter radiotolerans]|uniref:Sigma70-ECF: RNA polymerase sigma factor, sigma-70 family n=1 Tax=Rubrobacter radiotolerans TaxID=42256 RepID=A0A023WZE2_RUBRA|nr:sigma-70 family RNA polymerase sigma factor [Rubrobacter radiotolerans]AHY45557.1 sigma70-ECF: RNA polymerase sigma factor, sigma-70 family [Rubrobacter radiotolerans]SMC02835.1 RNA polymerase sigma-70 factor, ECF subfamily [Rubrobacter radiotolerans DSM 5868]